MSDDTGESFKTTGAGKTDSANNNAETQREGIKPAKAIGGGGGPDPSAYGQASISKKAAFSELLALPDPELFGYLLGSQNHDDLELANAIEKIRRGTPT
jgi:hypothetical protein